MRTDSPSSIPDTSDSERRHVEVVEDVEDVADISTDVLGNAQARRAARGAIHRWPRVHRGKVGHVVAVECIDRHTSIGVDRQSSGSDGPAWRVRGPDRRR